VDGSAILGKLRSKDQRSRS